MKNKLAITFLIVLGIVLYTLTIRGEYGNPQESTITQLEERARPFELSPERGRFAHVMALAEHQDYALSQNLADFVYPDVGYYNGKFFSYFAPGMSYMAVPLYLIGKHFNLSQVFTFAIDPIFAILCLIFIYRICRDVVKQPAWSSVLAALIFGFGSTSWSYSTTLYQHSLTTFFIISSFYAIFRYKNNGSWSWALFVWINYGLAITIDYPNALIMFPIMVYLLIVSFKFDLDSFHKKLSINFRTASALTAIGFVAVMGWHLYHNQQYFGNWKQLSGGLIGYKTIVENHLFDAPNPDQAIAQFQAQKENLVGFFTETNLAQGLHILTTSRDRGLFFYGPIFILGVIGLFQLVKKQQLEYSILAATVITNVFLYSSWGDPWGGWAYGTRYLIPSMSILAIGAAYFVSQGRYIIWKKFLLSILLIYSSAIGFLGALTTNAVPPKVEADSLHVPYGYFYNIHLLKTNVSGDLVYNRYFNHVSLIQYGLMIFIPLVIIFLFLVFIMPLYESEH